MSLVEDAERFARVAHSGQVDKVGVPYAEHCAYVANALREAGFPEEVQIIGWLHDVVEDTEVTLEDLAEFCSPRVVAGVDAMTKRKSEKFEVYYERVKANIDATAVKWFDVEHNSLPERLGRISPDTQQRLRGKYERARELLVSARG